MLNFRRTTRSLIGVDVGSRFLKAAQVTAGPERPHLMAAACIERGSPGGAWTASEAQRLRGVLERRGFEGRRIVTAVPTARCLTGVLSLPPRDSGAPLDQIAAAEMARMHRCDVQQIQVAFWDLPRPARHDQGLPVMAAACRQDEAETLLSGLEGAGFDITALDIEGWALVRACRSHLLNAGGTTAILDLGYSAANLALVHGTTLIYKRMLGSAGLVSLIESMQHDQRFDLPVIDHLLTTVGFDDDAATRHGASNLIARVRGPLEAHFQQMAQELTLSLSYASHQYPDAPVQQLLLVGGGACIPGLSSLLAEWCEMDVAVATPQAVCEVPESLCTEGQAPELNMALGLALYRDEEAS